MEILVTELKKMKEAATPGGMKDEIIAAARASFYENGYSNTTYASLAKTLGVSPGSLTYHFASKADLGNEVHSQYVYEYHEMIRDWLMSHHGFYSLLMDYALQIRVGLKLYAEDEKTFRFYHEYAKNDLDRALLSGSAPIFPPYLRKEDLNAEEDEVVLFTAVHKAAAIALNIVYFSKDIKTDIAFFTDYKMRTLLSLAGVPEDVIESTMKESQAYFDEMDIVVLPEFKVCARA